MSVTFSAAMGTILGYDLTCGCGARYLSEGETPMSSEVALATLITVREAAEGLPTCREEDCFHYGIFTSPVEEGGAGPDVNMANRNALMVLEALGLMAPEGSFEDSCCGTLPAEDFMGRVLMALAVAPVSPERPTLVEYNGYSEDSLADIPGAVAVESGPSMVHCGVPEGYLQERLEQLREVAEFALAAGRDVQWS